MAPRTPVSAPEHALPPGTLLQRYEIVRVLAEDSVGIDYLATDRVSGAEILVKEYFPSRLARRVDMTMVPRAPDEDTEPLARGLQAFLAEGHLLARIEHPALVHVTAVIEANGTAYQVLPQRGGVSLLEVRKELRSPPDEVVVRSLIDGLLAALQALHDAHTVHGSVTPAHVLLLAGDHPLLLGPPLARGEVSNELIESLMASVEPAFGAPEQRQPSPQRPLGPWTDLYGLAATMRYFISGELPPPVHELPPEGAHEPMADMVERTCRHGPDAPRYSAALLRALDEALGHVSGARPKSVAAFRAVLGTMPPRRAVPNAAASTGPTRAQGPLPPPTPLAAHTAPAAPATRPFLASEPPAVDAVPGMIASRLIEPDPEPDDRFDIDRIVTRSARHGADPQPYRPRQGARWVGAGFAALVAVAALGGWWATRDVAPLVMPATSAGPAAVDATPPLATAPNPAPNSTRPPAPIATPAPVPQAAQDRAPVAESAAPPPAQRAPIAQTPTRAPLPHRTAAPPEPVPVNPREACAGRTQFSLYRCMQTQCASEKWSEHPQCIRLRATDSVD